MCVLGVSVLMGTVIRQIIMISRIRMTQPLRPWHGCHFPLTDMYFITPLNRNVLDLHTVGIGGLIKPKNYADGSVSSSIWLG